ncbi:hypothetical protein DNU06_01100 [Putridiphycobacter roseus]|uniref:Hemerythrin-like domain-containing protein n=1 Tax=Putridiphycobacter roseus TaxID=2219161 RepID=A0A2W1N4E1_9FLAO|nr:hypothetical protein [Putridiphycobacter roseus]PZE18460.1 hypothetical protein DNU06_01100 [Putridiphycobacter roseus]
MYLSEDYKNIVKLRFKSLDRLSPEFFEELYAGIINPENFDIKSFEQFSLEEVLEYLKKSHSEYLNVWFPQIESLVKEVQKEFGINDTTLTLKSFVVNYYNELTTHINFEEKVLYNFVEKLLQGTYVEKEKVFVLNHFLETHNHDVSDELSVIQKVLINKDPTLTNHQSTVALFEKLNIIENDLTIHGLVEDELLIEKIHQYIADQF